MSNTVARENTVVRRTSIKPDGRLVWLVFVAACIAFLPFLGTAGMFDPTDSFFIEAGREMLETHRFIVPLMNYEQWLDKPALDFCLIAASLGTFGINEFAGRLPAALSGIAEVVVLFVLTSQLLTRRQALLSSLVLTATPLFIVVGRTSLSDEPLSLFLTMSLLSFAIASIKKSQLFLLPAYAALGVAILLKGPPLAMVFTGLIVSGFLVWSRRRDALRDAFKLRPVLGLIGALVFAAPYYIWAHVGTNGEFTSNFFLRQNLGRAAGTVNHVRPFWWYLPVVLGGTFPWSISLLLAWNYLKRIALCRFTQSTQRQELLKFSIIWVVLGFIFFSAVPTKLETYIVPVLPGIAILSGCFLDVLVRVNSMARKRGAAAVLFCCVSLIAVASPIAIQMAFDKSGQCLLIDSLAAVSILALCGLGARELYKNSSRFVYALVTAGLVTVAVFIPVLFVVYNKAYQQPVDELVAYARARKAELAVAYFPMPSVIYRYGHAIPVIKSRKEMLAYAEGAPDRRWILINKDVLDLLDWTERSPRVVAHEGRWWLFAIGKNCTSEDTVEWHGLKKGPYPGLADKRGD